MYGISVRRSTSRLTFALLAAGVFAAACGGSSSGTKTTVASNPNPSSASTGAATSPAAARVSITTHKSPVGTYLTDAKGHALYMFALDSHGTSMCSGACATTWPPLVGAGAQTSGAANAADAATITRGDGSMQVTYAGHPLYYYSGDSKAGDTNGQGLNVNGGKWWLVAPSGKPITMSAPAASSSTESGWS